MVTAGHRARRAGRALLLLWAAVVSAAVDAAQSVEFRVDGRVFQADLHRPVVAARGTVVLAHGAMRDRHSMSTLASELADRGALVIVPDLPFLTDANANATALASIVIDVRAGRFGPVPAKTVLIGYSAGGLATLLAAVRAPGITGWIGLDPVDHSGEGVHAAARVSPPAVMLRAAPDRCNAYANSHSWGSFLPRLIRDTLVEGATHCDFDDAADLVCAAICGAADPQRQAAIRAEVAEAIERWLQ
jgi:pimeloyl-ACP methyl ester carboxylesterase